MPPDEYERELIKEIGFEANTALNAFKTNLSKDAMLNISRRCTERIVELCGILVEKSNAPESQNNC